MRDLDGEKACKNLKLIVRSLTYLKTSFKEKYVIIKVEEISRAQHDDLVRPKQKSHESVDGARYDAQRFAELLLFPVPVAESNAQFKGTKIGTPTRTKGRIPDRKFTAIQL